VIPGPGGVGVSPTAIGQQEGQQGSLRLCTYRRSSSATEALATRV
jgi:hypothetical protein